MATTAFTTVRPGSRPALLHQGSRNSRHSSPATLAGLAREVWRTDPLLTATGLVLLALTAPFAFGIWMDQRLITGAPAWLKPAKFAISTGIYTLTLAWIFTYLIEWPRVRRVVGRATAAVMLLELAIIALQAARGVPSHFNVSTALDGVLFTLMGVGIFAQTTSTIAVAVALWRQRFADPALGWALRLGMLFTIIGGFSGGLMPGPTSAQLAEARITGRLPAAGAHTVGAPDGGPGLPVTKWSTQHGDLRVAHFIGLHALQALPLFAVFSPRRGNERARTRAVFTAAGAYFLLFVATLIQALLGYPLVRLA